MNSESYLIWAKVAGIGGAAIGALVLIFRTILHRQFLTKLSKKHSFFLLIFITTLTWITSLAGITAWYLIESTERSYSTNSLYAVTRLPPGETLSVRVGPGQNNDSIAELPPNTRNIQVIGDQKAQDGGVWFKIRYNGMEGWVNSWYLKPQ